MKDFNQKDELKDFIYNDTLTIHLHIIVNQYTWFQLRSFIFSKFPIIANNLYFVMYFENLSSGIRSL